jgi:hypothetical protein
MVVLFVLVCFLQGQAQNEVRTVKNTSPVFAISSNLLYDATTSMNLGLEFRVAQRLTLKLPVTYNPWTFSDNKKFKFLLAQPELRWWLCEPFSGHFFGLHAHYALFNVGGMEAKWLENIAYATPAFALDKQYRYQGDLYGVGISYGYQFYLAPRWNLELNLGVGYARINYDKYPCEKCGTLLEADQKRDYFGPTQAGISLIYIIK